MQPDAISPWCSTCAVCVSVGYMRCFGRHRYTYAPPARCRTSQYRRTFILFLVSLWNDLGDSVFDGVGLEGFKSWANASFLAFATHSFFVFCCFLFIFFLSMGWYYVTGVFRLIGCQFPPPYITDLLSDDGKVTVFLTLCFFAIIM